MASAFGLSAPLKTTTFYSREDAEAWLTRQSLVPAESQQRRSE